MNHLNKAGISGVHRWEKTTTCQHLLSLLASLPSVFYGVTAGEKRRAFPSALHPFFENMWPGNNWVTTAADQRVGLDLENDSIYFCLTACCSHSCTFYPLFRIKILLYMPGRQPDVRVEHRLSISIQDYPISKYFTCIQLLKHHFVSIPFLKFKHHLFTPVVILVPLKSKKVLQSDFFLLYNKTKEQCSDGHQWWSF